MKLSKVTLLLSFLLLTVLACNKTFVIEDVNYAQYVESVLIPDEQGFVSDIRNNISFSINELSNEEFGENSDTEVNEIRLIRNHQGYYFITADQFKNVYVFEPKRGQLKLKETIEVSMDGLQAPVFNWRDPYVEIIANNQVETHYLNERGIISDNSKEGK